MNNLEVFPTPSNRRNFLRASLASATSVVAGLTAGCLSEADQPPSDSIVAKKSSPDTKDAEIKPLTKPSENSSSEKISLTLPNGELAQRHTILHCGQENNVFILSNVMAITFEDVISDTEISKILGDDLQIWQHESVAGLKPRNTTVVKSAAGTLDAIPEKLKAAKNIPVVRHLGRVVCFSINDNPVVMTDQMIMKIKEGSTKEQLNEYSQDQHCKAFPYPKSKGFYIIMPQKDLSDPMTVIDTIKKFHEECPHVVPEKIQHAWLKPFEERSSR